jgi:hypothetical protein
MSKVMQFVQLDEKKRDAAALEGLSTGVDRAITRMRMDLEDDVTSAKANVAKVSAITTLANFSARNWITTRNDALNALADAEQAVSEFNTNFSEEA